MHKNKSSLAGKEILIKEQIKHPQYPNFGGSKIKIEDWWDRVYGKSWMYCVGHPACLIYAIRTGFNKNKVPTDNEVLYGHREDGLGSLIHITELEL